MSYDAKVNMVTIPSFSSLLRSSQRFFKFATFVALCLGFLAARSLGSLERTHLAAPPLEPGALNPDLTLTPYTSGLSRTVVPHPKRSRQPATGHHTWPRPVNPRVPVTPFDFEIEAAGQENRVDPLLVKAIIAVESEFDQYSVSAAGACGLMQLVPSTARLLGVKDIFNPRQNIQGGARHFRYMLNRFSNNVALALAAYNAGEAPVMRYKGIPPYAETQWYVRRVLKIYNSYRNS